MESDVAVQFKNVEYEINNSKILKEINGAFIQGKLTSIIGPSGAGKSTLLTLINLLKSATKGEIVISGKTIDSYDPMELRRKVQLVSQEATMIKGTVKDNLELPLILQNKNMTDEEAEQYLENVDLSTSFLNKNSKELSGGEKQKLSLARALVNKPSIILLDEVTSALDRNSKQAIELLLQKIKREHNVTMIWITHDINQALRMSDYVWVMKNGEVVETNTVEEIENSKNTDVKSVIGEKSI
ncbi:MULTISPECIES: ABC transporter ATP-binding protein [Mammaliicoccus]|uniref:Phosphate ABC transporter ATP-binding protein n=1 Tax=Mammaliicoccus vitulinus TaxID=71237 RepID=A0A2T4PU46_9STAP|nr:MULTISPECIES: phosphate ABC transporter ATP-binding protein [Mammaliicoccus]PTI29909.1 phosphate ABC transporter ATP-binding protein [Mammaliicoccus vitulinus]PTI36680.1 phosphate ABC transporter ATP-binding protein [Mammaliicoccus vitulinus]PTI86365.1 phosphate ABC transporter ATP-binding protein [Mammaliicoccus vitulinus]QQT14419.1 phosphate ABC transporter ATP-binding protein [Mammaliicoccus vitulinus]QQY20280.1 phosphate ABC transporter ATP-binding protein [Mammaliicoccus vitulinus]